MENDLQQRDQRHHTVVQQKVEQQVLSPENPAMAQIAKRKNEWGKKRVVWMKMYKKRKQHFVGRKPGRG